MSCRLPTLARFVLLALGAVVAGCGFSVQSPDLFVLTRTGQGKPLTLLVNDAGTVRCDGGPPKPVSDPLLLQARQVATDLDQDAKARLQIPPARGSVFTYTIKLQDGTVSFADTAAARHPELSRAELFAVQAVQGPCGLSQ